MKLGRIASLFGLGCIWAMGISTSASAASPQLADLAVSIQPPSSHSVNSFAAYRVRVANIGKRTASAVNLTVNLPLTNTSPNRYLFGQINQLDSRCNIQGERITCALGNILAGRNAEISFQYSIPVSMAALVIRAQAATSSQELSQANNAAMQVPQLIYRSTQIVGPIVAHNSHCTGVNLSSFFECELFPASISMHDVNFHGDGTLTIDGYPTFTGVWHQNSNQELAFQYFDDGVLVADFHGLGSLDGCFDGITQFPDSNYVSPYRVCF